LTHINFHELNCVDKPQVLKLENPTKKKKKKSDCYINGSKKFLKTVEKPLAHLQRQQ